jgi:hypothetical protein
VRVGGFIIPVNFDLFSLVAVAFVVLAVLIIVWGLARIARERRFHFFHMSSGLVLLLFGLLVLAIAGWAQTYRALTHNEWVADIHAVPTRSQTMQVTYTPVTNGGTMGTPQTYTVLGDEWTLGGDVIKWQDWVNILGVDTGYRVTRLMGYYDNPNDYKTKVVSAYTLDGGNDTMQQFLRDHQNLVPFVRATYGNDVRMYPNATATYQVFVSTSGYWTAQK